MDSSKQGRRTGRIFPLSSSMSENGRVFRPWAITLEHLLKGSKHLRENANIYNSVRMASGNYWRSSDLVMVSVLGSLERVSVALLIYTQSNNTISVYAKPKISLQCCHNIFSASLFFALTKHVSSRYRVESESRHAVLCVIVWCKNFILVRLWMLFFTLRCYG